MDSQFGQTECFFFFVHEFFYLKWSEIQISEIIVMCYNVLVWETCFELKVLKLFTIM